MDISLRGIKIEEMLIYLEIQGLGALFLRLRKSNFEIQLDKHEFSRKKSAYPGHLVTFIKSNPDKHSAIKTFPIPKTTKQNKFFLRIIRRS